MTDVHVDFECDVLVIGGGINGAGIARDAAGRGLRVILCEKDDLAAHTSSASSKLIHGGLRYLEYFEFGLVRKALQERETLMRVAPHIISARRFVMPHRPEQRPAWLIRMGLFLYDHLAKRELLSGSCSVDLQKHIAGHALRSEWRSGFIYSDGWVDDARLVVLNAMSAHELGAQILCNTRCVELTRAESYWHAQLEHKTHGARLVKARFVVNAAGAWAADLQHRFSSELPFKQLRLVQGSHIVVRRLFEHNYAYIFQNGDGRIVFALPYERDFTLIGTTDLDFKGDLNRPSITEQEMDYLIGLCNQYFQKQIARDQVLWSYSGVRPLVDDGQRDAKAITRDYRIEFDESRAPIMHIFGGKITTYRRLAEEACNRLALALDCSRAAWTSAVLLPGGDLFEPQPSNKNVIQIDQFIAIKQQRYGFLPPDLVQRYCRLYGSRIDQIMDSKNSLASMGDEVVKGLFQAEIEYLRKNEFATSAQDILWRRTKLGLIHGSDAEEKLAAWLDLNPYSLPVWR